jgi:PAS domain S-box-containing protein
MSGVEPLLFQSVCDGMPLGICLVDVQGRIIYWNAAAEAISGYLRQEVMGRVYRADLLLAAGQRNGDVITPDQRCPLDRVLRDGRPVAAEMFLRHKDGHRAPVHVEAFPLRDATGGICAVAQILDHQRGKLEVACWPGRPDHPLEGPSALPSMEATRERLLQEITSPASQNTALLLLEMRELSSIMQHGGAALVRRALPVLAKTVAEFMPPRAFIGYWSAERLLVCIPECSRRFLEDLLEKLAGAGTACEVKWWGDRLPIRARAVARFAQPELPAEAQILALELQLTSAAKKKE